jgi:GH24 family phage-related lysozyme (muramidase)
LKSRRNKKSDWDEHPFLTDVGIELIKKHGQPRTAIGMGRFAAYKDFGESMWRIGYGSHMVGKRRVAFNEKLTKSEIETQLIEDLKEFSDQVSEYVFVPLNDKRSSTRMQARTRSSRSGARI